jgi:hypothetical protein
MYYQYKLARFEGSKGHGATSDDVVTLTTLNAVILLDEPTEKCTIAQIPARFSLLMFGADALTPAIVKRVWGQDNVERHNLGGLQGDLTIIHRCLILLTYVASITFHLWLTTSLEGTNIMRPSNMFRWVSAIHPPTCQKKSSTSYVRKPLPPDKDHIQNLQHKL